MSPGLSVTLPIRSSGTECEAGMIYNEDDVTLYAKMSGKTYLIGHPDIMSEMMYADGTYVLRLCLNSEHVERFLAVAKEAGLV